MSEMHKQAEEMIRSRGERPTAGRVRILAALLAEQRAITHHELEERVRCEQRLDRVTVYRVLEWLHEKCFVHRVVTGERVWRFRANSGGIASLMHILNAPAVRLSFALMI